MFICRDSHRFVVLISLVCSTMRLSASWIRPRLTARNTGTTIRRMTHLLERHYHCQRVNQEQRSRLLTLCEGSRRCLVLLQILLSSTRNTMSESGPRWMKVATLLVTARVGQLVQNDISTCLVFSRSIVRAPETRFSQDLVATRLPQLDGTCFHC